MPLYSLKIRLNFRPYNGVTLTNLRRALLRDSRFITRRLCGSLFGGALHDGNADLLGVNFHRTRLVVSQVNGFIIDIDDAICCRQMDCGRTVRNSVSQRSDRARVP